MVFLRGARARVAGPWRCSTPASAGQALAVVLESGDVVGGGLDTQDEAEFVVDLDRGLTETMLDAGALDHVVNWLPISWASWGVILWPR